MNILGQYEIIYENGTRQIKNLISHSVFEQVIVPYQSLIRNAEISNNEDEANRLRTFLKNSFGEYWFTDASPLWEAHQTGVLRLPVHQGGYQKCLVKEIIA